MARNILEKMYKNIKVSNYKVSLPIKLEILSQGNPPEMPKVLFMFVRKDIVVQLFSRVQLQPHGLQHARLPCP